MAPHIAGRQSGQRDIRPSLLMNSQKNEEAELSYSTMEEVDAGIKLKTFGGLLVETTGTSMHIESNDIHVHEVVITEGVGEGNKYLYNLDSGTVIE
jgi:hypothetical protein